MAQTQNIPRRLWKIETTHSLRTTGLSYALYGLSYPLLLGCHSTIVLAVVRFSAPATTATHSRVIRFA